MSHKKQVSYQSTNTYSILNSLTEDTQNIWIACHGIGYLSKFFISYFEDLDPKLNYIIAPQAPSKYYQTKAYKYVGASWLTKENRELETENVLNYLDALLEMQELPTDKKIILFGFSQGVSVVTRWMAQRKIQCDHLVIHSGSIPYEFDSSSFAYLPDLKTSIIYGTQDEYLTEERIQSQLELAKTIFPNPPEILKFKGKHVMHKASLKKISKQLA
ncbi:esterase [Psychroflexus sp. CAK57W]|uniref:alpha/beta hydrolase n=1 Tax=Psychroflexus curvus TaxID=2873595 RepID=UPI001CCEE304|nr:esterase [Psychroflexus curvus]MBZ9627613.1 esterase [Psychroflexus curvus]MBZ9786100.1 esterase [Psychroflexus curvus]